MVFSSEEPCYVGIKTSKEFNTVLVSEISTSLISQYIGEVQSIPPSGLSGKPSCIYEVSVTKDGEKTFVTLQGKDLNSYGDSKLGGTEGFEQSLLKSLYRSLRNKRKVICDDYGELIEKCGRDVNQDTSTKVESKVVESIVKNKVESIVVKQSSKTTKPLQLPSGEWIDVPIDFYDETPSKCPNYFERDHNSCEFGANGCLRGTKSDAQWICHSNYKRCKENEAYHNEAQTRNHGKMRC